MIYRPRLGQQFLRAEIKRPHSMGRRNKKVGSCLRRKSARLSRGRGESHFAMSSSLALALVGYGLPH